MTNMNDLPLIVPVNKFYIVRYGVWYEISKYEFKNIIKLNLPISYCTKATMTVYYLINDFLVIHQYYYMKNIRKYDIDFDYIMYGVTYGKT